jgi:hypothetical protein
LPRTRIEAELMFNLMVLAGLALATKRLHTRRLVCREN